MITAVHNLVYSDDAAATRAFFRDVLQWPFVTDDGHPGRAPTAPRRGSSSGPGPSEVGVHPTRGPEGSSWTSPRHHAISLMCDDLRLDDGRAHRSRSGIHRPSPPTAGYGLVVMMAVPGADDIQLYEPRHTTAYDR